MKIFVGILDKGFELTFTKNKAVFEKNDYEKKNFTFIFVYVYCVCKLHIHHYKYSTTEIKRLAIHYFKKDRRKGEI